MTKGEKPIYRDLLAEVDKRASDENRYNVVERENFD